MNNPQCFSANQRSPEVFQSEWAPWARGLPESTFGTPSELLQQLGHGHEPVAVMLICSDLDAAPFELAHANEGEVYVIQNFANTVPPTGGGRGSPTLGSLCLGMQYPSVRHLIVCGHVECRCLDSSRNQFSLNKDLCRPPDNNRILFHPTCGPTAIRNVEAAAMINVVLQLKNLLNHAFIRQRVRSHNLKVHGWLLDDRSATLSHYHPRTGKFE